MHNVHPDYFRNDIPEHCFALVCTAVSLYLLFRALLRLRILDQMLFGRICRTQSCRVQRAGLRPILQTVMLDFERHRFGSRGERLFHPTEKGMGRQSNCWHVSVVVAAKFKLTHFNKDAWFR